MDISRTEEEQNDLYKQFLNYFFEEGGRFPSANYVRLKKATFSLFFRRGTKAEDAEDIWQETFCDLENGALRRYTFNFIDSVYDRRLENYVIGIAYKRRAKIYGKRRRKDVLLEEPHNEIFYIEQQDKKMELKELDFLVREQIEELPETQRAPFLLRAEGYSHKDIAIALGISYGAARVRVSKARRKVRERIIQIEPSVGETL